MISKKILNFRWHIYCKRLNFAIQLCQIKPIHAEVLADSSGRVLKKFQLRQMHEKSAVSHLIN